MIDLILVTAPAVEPVTVDDVLQDLGYGPSAGLDPATLDALTGRIQPKILAARINVEQTLRRALITQTWRIQLDGFPGYSTRYERTGYPEIRLPKPPFQRVRSFQYVDTAGILQPLTQDTSFGNTTTPQYAYQLDPGGYSQPARLMPPFARPWPPTRMVPNNVQIVFDCGYGDTADAVPAPIKLAIRLWTQYLYEQGAAADTAMPRVVELMLGTEINRLS